MSISGLGPKYWGGEEGVNQPRNVPSLIKPPNELDMTVQYTELNLDMEYELMQPHVTFIGIFELVNRIEENPF